MALNVIYKNRNGTTAEWAASTYILEKGELGVDTTLNIAKIGDGVKTWKDLPTFNDVDISNLVTTDTTQTITGNKTFGGGANFENGISVGRTDSTDRLNIGVDSDTHTGMIDFISESVVGCTLTLPDGVNGTIATLEDIPTNFVTTDTEQTISSLKSFSQGINVNGVNDKFGNNLITVGSNGILVGSSVGGDNSALILCGKAPKPKYSTDGGTTSVELALISDIPSIPTNYVTTDTAQTISGSKTFSGTISFTEAVDFSKNITAKNGITLKAGPQSLAIKYNDGWVIQGDTTVSGVPYPGTIYFPDGNGTLALTKNIPTNYVTTDTAQTISGVKTFTGAIQLQGVGIAAKVGGENSSYTNILKGGGNVVEVGSTGYQTRIYSNGRISVYDYSTSPYTSEKVAYQSEIPTNYVTIDTEQTISGSKTFKDNFKVVSSSDSSNYLTLSPGNISIQNIDIPKQLSIGADSIGSYSIYSQGGTQILKFQSENMSTGDTATLTLPTKSGTIALTSDIPDLSIAPIKVKDTFVASSWATSSAATDTQFGKYYKDVTIPNKNIINVRCVSTKGMSGITLDYAPEIKCNNRRTSDTNLRIYSNSQLEGAVTITLVGDTLPNKFSKTNATLSASSWTTSSATVDTQFAKYYTDITVPAGDVMNIRILSNEYITGISTAAYYPEVWSDNRKIDSTTLRVYSNKQVAGSVIILTMEV